MRRFIMRRVNAKSTEIQRPRLDPKPKPPQKKTNPLANPLNWVLEKILPREPVAKKPLTAKEVLEEKRIADVRKNLKHNGFI